LSCAQLDARGGGTWTPQLSVGLPSGVLFGPLIVDPVLPNTLYAGKSISVACR
jgi:hypothetical protein